MLDRHAVQELLRAGVKLRAVAQQFRISRRTIERIAGEEKIQSAGDGVLRHERHGDERVVGRPRVTEAIRARMRALVLEDSDRPPGEICRLLKKDGTPLGLGTVYRVLTGVRATIPAALQVRFEGVAGEFAQFDFGASACGPPMAVAAPYTWRRTARSTRAGCRWCSCRTSASKR